MANITHESPVVTEDKLKDFYEDIKPFLGCPAYLTSEGNAEYYSTDEKVIGRWIDGKPLYQRTYTDTTPKVTTAGTYVVKNIPHNISNVDTIFIADSFVIDTASISRTMPYTLNNGNQIKASPGKSNIQTTSAVTDFNNCTMVITIRYTKTTDSASTTIQEDPNEYSTTEKIVGKWIDGKPIYQKTANKVFTIPGGTATTTLGDPITAFGNVIETIVDVKMTIVDSPSGWSGSQGGGVSYAIGETGEVECALWLNDNTHQIVPAYKNAQTWSFPVTVTLQYTKTTD